MSGSPWHSRVLIGCGIVGLIWVALSLFALVSGFTGHDPLFTLVPGSVVTYQLSLLGKVYLVTSGILPFVALGALLVS